MKTKLIKTISELKYELKERENIGLVPTMGALHEGHASLIKEAVKNCKTVVVSVFTNPIQFGLNEDYDKYPKTLDKDVELCESLGADFVFAPSVSEMYGENLSQGLHDNLLTTVCPPFALTDRLCGKSRPGHFDGVATVVTKLFNITGADYAFFGQKDAQQAVIVRKIVKDLNIPIEIKVCPIVRDEDGLAKSSRNSYLSPENRQKALCLSKILFQIKSSFDSGVTDTKTLFETGIAMLNEGVELEYLEFVNPDNLEEEKTAFSGMFVLIAAKVGDVRLIDNIIL